MPKTVILTDSTAEELSGQLCSNKPIDEIVDWEDFVGRNLFIRTVTYHLIGKVVSVSGNLMQLIDASWIANSGRFMQAIKNGSLQEVEPVGVCWVNTNSITDIFPWEHPLPKDQK